MPSTLRGTPWVAAFMFTRCPSVCPRITARMKELQAASQAAKQPLRLVSISVDPEYDSPAVLEAYAKKFALDTRSWSLLTGPYETIAQTAEQGFKIGLSGKADPSKPDLGLTHGSHLILVDKNNEIRGYYRSFEEDVVARLVADLARL
jgi:protein SCO1/2